jgi:hypothetical protein
MPPSGSRHAGIRALRGWGQCLSLGSVASPVDPEPPGAPERPPPPLPPDALSRAPHPRAWPIGR